MAQRIPAQEAFSQLKRKDVHSRPSTSLSLLLPGMLLLTAVDGDDSSLIDIIITRFSIDFLYRRRGILSHIFLMSFDVELRVDLYFLVSTSKDINTK
ncbi:20297_t:CDS:2, partial [Gigaspora rosea]